MPTPFILRPAARSAALVAGTAVLVGALTACSDTDDSLRPSAYGPTVAGHASCAYVVSAQECADSGVPAMYWYQMPTQEPAHYHERDTSDWLSMLFLWHLMFEPWYASPAYYGTYVPTRYRSTYITRHVTTFETTYRTTIDAESKKATYKTASGKTVTGNKVNPRRFSTPNNGGDRHRTGACDAFTLDLSQRTIVLAKGFSGSSRSGTGSRSNTGSRSRNAGGDRGRGTTSRRGC